MPLEREFISKRFAIVKQEKGKIDKMMVDAPHKVKNQKKINVRREYRLLGKISAEVPEGRVLETLQKWREQHCRDLQDHKQRTRRALRSAERYWDQYNIYVEFGELPPVNPSQNIKIKDSNGYTWIIDDHFIRLLDRLIQQLQRWMAYEE